MSFVNEFASEEDIKNYDLVALMDEYRPSTKGRHFEFSSPMLTIDRERNIFLIFIRHGLPDMDHCNRAKILMWINGEKVIIEIDQIDSVKNNPDGIKSTPYIITWELVEIYPPANFAESRNFILQLLEETLSIYGFDGANKQIPNTIVRFKF